MDQQMSHDWRLANPHQRILKVSKHGDSMSYHPESRQTMKRALGGRLGM